MLTNAHISLDAVTACGQRPEGSWGRRGVSRGVEGCVEGCVEGLSVKVSRHEGVCRGLNSDTVCMTVNDTAVCTYIFLQSYLTGMLTGCASSSPPRKWCTQTPCAHGLVGHVCTFTKGSEPSGPQPWTARRDAASAHNRDVRSAQPLAERMTLQPVVTRDDPTYKTGKHATRSVSIHTCACAAVLGTLTPVLHHTTSHPPQFALPRRSCRGGARSATIPGCWLPLR